MGLPLLLIDDDEQVIMLGTLLLQEGGFVVESLMDPTKAIETIKKVRPAAVLLDILMPHVDGLTVLHQIRSDEELKDLKVIMVSGKTFPAEKKRAHDLGADGFINKPYNVETFAKEVWALLGSEGQAGETGAAKEPEARTFKPVDDAKLKVTVWGCRSLSPAAAPTGSRYGTRTSCVSVETPENLFIFDGGSGIEPLGEDILEKGRHKKLSLFLTHFHQDHIEGLARFVCARTPGFKIDIFAANDADKTLEDMVAETFERGDGPVEAEIELHALEEKPYDILSGVRLIPFYANHPSTTLGFVLETQERKLVFSPDAELYGEDARATQDYDERLAGLASGADLLIHDGRYSEEDYLARRDTGHSSTLNAVRLAARCGVKRLLLVHHDDQYSDEALDANAEEVERLVSFNGFAVEALLAREGLTFGI